MRTTLKLWIAQSESWQVFKDLKLPTEAQADYPFLKRKNDFFLSLYGTLFDLLRDAKRDQIQPDLLSVAKGLAIYSLKNTKDNFRYIDVHKNLIHASALYYLAGYSSSSWLLASIYGQELEVNYIDKFILLFLTRKFDESNYYSSTFKSFMSSGDFQIINALIEQLIYGLDKSAASNRTSDYCSFSIAIEILKKFRHHNLWFNLQDEVIDNPEAWTIYITNLINRKIPIWDFFPSQIKAINRGVLKNKTTSLQMPTSSGKTAICELVIYDQMIKNSTSKILFLAPFRALASELKFGFSRKLSELGIKVRTSYGGTITSINELNDLDDVNLLITTPEKFLAMERMNSQLVNTFNLIICDEGHLIDNSHRGLGYELLLSKLKANSDENTRFLFLSAIVPNLNQINTWLGGDEASLVKDTFKPTEVEIALLRQSGENSYRLEVNPEKQIPQNYFLQKFLSEDDFIISLYKNGKPKFYNHKSIKAKSVATSLKCIVFGPVAIFATDKSHRTGVAGLANEVIKQITQCNNLPKPLSYANLEGVSKYRDYFQFMFGDQYLLSRVINYGFLVHHGDLPQNIREVIEDAIQQKIVSLVICTNTLAEGVNLPIKTMVLHSIRRFDGSNMQYLKIRDLKNITGRVGRASKETKGLIISTNSTEFHAIKQILKDNTSESISGYLYKVIKTITKFIKNNTEIQLNNEFLDSQSENFLQLIDIIDSSIIDLLGEELTNTTLEIVISKLVEETFAYQQSTLEEKVTLKKLFHLRSLRLKPYIEEGKLEILKKSYSTPRIFDEIELLIGDNFEFWTEIDPIGDEWINYIFNIIQNLTQYKYELDSFNQKNKTKFEIQDIKEIIILWISGLRYGEIASRKNISVDLLLKIFCSHIEYSLQMIVTKIILIGESKLAETNNFPSFMVLNWASYLLLGINSKIQLDLIYLGFTERTTVFCIEKYLIDINYKYESVFDLRAYIVNDPNQLILYLNGKIPDISLDKAKIILNYLSLVI